MNFKCVVTLMIMLIMPMAHANSPKEIQVYLSKTSCLDPLYLGKISCVDDSFSEGYLRQLDSILRFDLGYNGQAQLISFHPEKEKAIASALTSFHAAEWRAWGVSYMVHAHVQDKALQLSLFSSQSQTAKQFTPIKLSGRLSEDRKLLHHLLDNLTKAAWKKSGVASCKILYAVKKQKGNQAISEIWCCDWDGSNPTQVTHENSYGITPVFFSQSSNKFLYVSYQYGIPKICIASLSEGKGQKMIELKGNQLLPALSLQKDKLAFISDASGRADLFIVPISKEGKAVSKPIQLFSYPRSTQASPTFNPDGSQLAFVSDKEGTPRIYLLPSSYQTKRQEPILLSKKNRENSCPAWSPDGQKLAYSAKTQGVRQIWIYDFETQEEWQLTDGPTNKENPAWAPNSTHLVFNSTDGHSSELYLVNLNQPEAVKISSGEGVKHYPAWTGK
ncbi:MAG: Tol-Pal system protein TolB [Candidatus Rhabdochlamydia sp.]